MKVSTVTFEQSLTCLHFATSWTHIRELPCSSILHRSTSAHVHHHLGNQTLLDLQESCYHSPPLHNFLLQISILPAPSWILTVLDLLSVVRWGRCRSQDTQRSCCDFTFLKQPPIPNPNVIPTTHTTHTNTHCICLTLL